MFKTKRCDNVHFIDVANEIANVYDAIGDDKSTNEDLQNHINDTDIHFSYKDIQDVMDSTTFNNCDPSKCYVDKNNEKGDSVFAIEYSKAHFISSALIKNITIPYDNASGTGISSNECNLVLEVFKNSNDDTPSNVFFSSNTDSYTSSKNEYSFEFDNLILPADYAFVRISITSQISVDAEGNKTRTAYEKFRIISLRLIGATGKGNEDVIFEKDDECKVYWSSPNSTNPDTPNYIANFIAEYQTIILHKDNEDRHVSEDDRQKWNSAIQGITLNGGTDNDLVKVGEGNIIDITLPKNSVGGGTEAQHGFTFSTNENGDIGQGYSGHYLRISAAEYTPASGGTTGAWAAGTTDYFTTASSVKSFVNDESAKTLADAKSYALGLHSSSVEYVVEDSLPNIESGKEEETQGKIYLVNTGENGATAADGARIEYMYINKGTKETPQWGWEQIGTTTADLTGYAKSVKINGTTYTASAANAGALDLGTVASYIHLGNVITSPTDLTNVKSVQALLGDNGCLYLGIASATESVMGVSKMFTDAISSTPSLNESTINEQKKTAVSVKSAIDMYSSLASAITSTKTGVDIGTKGKEYNDDDDDSGFLKGVSKINFMGAFVNVVKKDNGTVTVWINKDNNKPTPDDTSSIEFDSDVLRKYYVFDGDNYDIPTTNGSQTSESICHEVSENPTITLKGTKDGVESNTISIPNITSKIKAVVCDTAGTVKATCTTDVIKSGMNLTQTQQNISIEISNLTQFGENDAEDGHIPDSVQFDCKIKPTLSPILSEGDTWSMKVFKVDEEGNEELIEKFGDYFAYTSKAATIAKKTDETQTLTIVESSSETTPIKTRYVSGEQYVAKGSKFDVTYGTMSNTSYMVTDKATLRGEITVTSCDTLSLNGSSSDKKTTTFAGGTSTFTLGDDTDMKDSLTCEHTAYSIGGNATETATYTHTLYKIWATGRDDTYNTAYFEKEQTDNVGYGRILGHVEDNKLVINSTTFDSTKPLTSGNYANQAKVYDNQLQYGSGTGNKYYVRKFKYSDESTDTT